MNQICAKALACENFNKSSKSNCYYIDSVNIEKKKNGRRAVIALLFLFYNNSYSGRHRQTPECETFLKPEEN